MWGWNDPNDRKLTWEEAESVAGVLTCPWCGEEWTITWGNVEHGEFNCSCGHSFDIADPNLNASTCEFCGKTFMDTSMVYDDEGNHICELCWEEEKRNEVNDED